MSNATLLARVEALQSARKAEAELKAQTTAKQAEFNIANADLLADVKAAALAIASEETAVKAMALEMYNADGNTTPVPGVTIKFFANMGYDSARALQWAKDAKLAVLPESLNVKEFERIAKATKLEFVTYGSEPRPTIAADLGKALASVADAEALV